MLLPALWKRRLLYFDLLEALEVEVSFFILFEIVNLFDVLQSLQVLLMITAIGG